MLTPLGHSSIMKHFTFLFIHLEIKCSLAYSDCSVYGTCTEFLETNPNFHRFPVGIMFPRLYHIKTGSGIHPILRSLEKGGRKFHLVWSYWSITLTNHFHSMSQLRRRGSKSQMDSILRLADGLLHLIYVALQFILDFMPRLIKR